MNVEFKYTFLFSPKSWLNVSPESFITFEKINTIWDHYSFSPDWMGYSNKLRRLVLSPATFSRGKGGFLLCFASPFLFTIKKKALIYHWLVILNSNLDTILYSYPQQPTYFWLPALLQVTGYHSFFATCCSLSRWFFVAGNSLETQYCIIFPSCPLTIWKLPTSQNPWYTGLRSSSGNHSDMFNVRPRLFLITHSYLILLLPFSILHIIGSVV